MKTKGLNFNRPALKAAAVAQRRRVIHASLAASYLTLLGALAVYLCVEAILLERALLAAQNSLGNVRGLENLSQGTIDVDPGFLDLIGEVASSDKRWTERLQRLTTILPPNAWLVKVEAGAVNASLRDKKRHQMNLNISAMVKDDEERVFFPMRFVEGLKKDPLFSKKYRDIRFSSSRVLARPGRMVVNFDVECR